MSRVFRTFEDYKKHPDYKKCLDKWSTEFMKKWFKVIPRDYFQKFKSHHLEIFNLFLSENPNITWKIVQVNPDIDWHYDYLSLNPNITWEIVQANPDKNWDYEFLSENPNITWEIVQENPGKNWNYSRLSKNPNITWEIITNNLDKPWEFESLNLQKERETFIMNCLNNDRYNARKALMPTTKEELNTKESTNKVLGNKDIMGNIFSFLGGRKTRGKKITKKGKTFKRMNNKSRKT